MRRSNQDETQVIVSEVKVQLTAVTQATVCLKRIWKIKKQKKKKILKKKKKKKRRRRRRRRRRRMNRKDDRRYRHADIPGRIMRRAKCCILTCF